jgi:lon-related putative ATP-dependent protease
MRKPRKKLEAVVEARSSRVRREPPPRGARPVVDKVVLRRIGRLRVPTSELVWRCSPREFSFATTREVAPLDGMLGHSQALRSLRMALGVQGTGYNVFVCGLNGAECIASIERYIRSLRLPSRPGRDLCYVQNFDDWHRPKLLNLPPGEGPRLEEAIASLLRRLHRALAKAPERSWRRKARGILDEAIPHITHQFDAPAVGSWLARWKRNILENIHHAAAEDYQVNCFHRKQSSSSAPVVVERMPHAPNLFGWIGRRAIGDQAPAPHFTEIRGGSVLDADGGVLLLNAADFHSLSSSWSLLKSCLKYGALQIEDSDPNNPTRSGGLKPDPVPVQAKVVLLGDFELYDHLYEADPDFREIFKIRVDFDSEVPLTSRVLRREYPGLIARACRENNLRPLTASGVARVLEFGVRKAGRKGKITTQSWLVADLLREADYWAGLAGRRVVAEADVHRAIEESIQRLNLVETKIAEMISEGTILITTSGRRIGQVNGLAIYDMGDYVFGKPSRITAETSYGQGGIINIERESGFSGRSHDKGVQILAGYLRSRFAQNRPLNLTASVCFEQSYSGIDGDSASATEIYAILSSLSGLPIRQDVAVTGSLNQKGDIQPIGSVNEKIEGFYDCVRAGRFTGREGVIIPRKNVNDLMLRDDVVNAVARGAFHIYAIDTVEQGFEILTGVPAGHRRRSGAYTSGSAFARVDRRLEDIANGLKQFQASDEG